MNKVIADSHLRQYCKMLIINSLCVIFQYGLLPYHKKEKKTSKKMAVMFADSK